jgi:hypothetical protein
MDDDDDDDDNAYSFGFLDSYEAKGSWHTYMNRRGMPDSKNRFHELNEEFVES